MLHFLSLRSWRFQFGLRALLLLMTVVGIGLTIYRWPWEEGGLGFSSHYHRGWNGKPVKHGWETRGYSKKTHLVERFFDEGEERLERAWMNDQVVIENRYLNRKRHGPFLNIDKKRRIEGSFQQGENHGKWVTTTADVIMRAEWKAGKRHGRRTWAAPDGRELQSAEYNLGKLVKWNDQSIDSALAHWLDGHVPDSELRCKLDQKVGRRAELHAEWCLYAQIQFSVGATRLVVQSDNHLPFENAEFSELTLGEVLLADALENDHTLAFRFNALNFVPITAKSLDWQDRTGVYDVCFDPGSRQENFWLEEVAADQFSIWHPAARFSKMFEPEFGKSLIIFVSVNLIDSEEHRLFSTPMRGPNPPRPRRDLLGHHLDRENCYVEQQGNRLIIKRRHAD
ncbi:hypothetical protein [Anatilimnocola floriformis]|uniref:hypothetical protein n=1 Tax=Anatilimnocola floriformis TaxID=2948575 RepID=UPI0020C2A8CC|nr:hypothetical protein [Anatilimnocola floriformis]